MNEISAFEGQPGHVGEFIKLGIVTVSDRASSGTYEDEGGPAILGFFEAALASPWEAHYRCVPDEIEAIEAALRELVDDVGCYVVVTTGGTGPAPRDVTPEATERVVTDYYRGSGSRCGPSLWPLSRQQFFPGRWVG